MVCTFGPDGFFGYSYITSKPHYPLTREAVEKGTIAPPGDLAMWWSKFESKTVPTEKYMDREVLRAHLLERYGDWSSPVIARIIEAADDSLQLPTYVMPKLPTWAGDGLLLVGDAAHAYPPQSGQGVSAAFEDAQGLTMILSHYLHQTWPSSATEGATAAAATAANPSMTLAAAVEETGRAYTSLRKPRSEKILDRALAIGDDMRKKSVFVEYLTYLLIWLSVWIEGDAWGNYLGNWDVEAEVAKLVK